MIEALFFVAGTVFGAGVMLVAPVVLRAMGSRFDPEGTDESQQTRSEPAPPYVWQPPPHSYDRAPELFDGDLSADNIPQAPESENPIGMGMA